MPRGRKIMMLRVMLRREDDDVVRIIGCRVMMLRIMRWKMMMLGTSVKGKEEDDVDND